VDRAEKDFYETVGMLVIEWGRLEEQFPGAQGPKSASVDVAAASRVTGISAGQLDRVRRLRNDAVHNPSRRPSLEALDEALGVLEMVFRATGGERPSLQTTTLRTMPPAAGQRGSDPPTAYPNPRNDNPWDNDAVHWLLDKPDVAAAFKRVPLFECLRCQPGRVRNQPHRVEEAARLARRHGVVQRQELDERLGKRIVRLYRTDADRPRYPGAPPLDASVAAIR